MSDDDEAVVTPTEPAEEAQGEYGLHIRLTREMQPVLKSSAELAFRMGDIPKPDLVDLINLFISLGTTYLEEEMARPLLPIANYGQLGIKSNLNWTKRKWRPWRATETATSLNPPSTSPFSRSGPKRRGLTFPRVN